MATSTFYITGNHDCTLGGAKAHKREQKGACQAKWALEERVQSVDPLQTITQTSLNVCKVVPLHHSGHRVGI